MYEIIDRAVDDENADKAIASVILFTDGRTNYGILRKEEILEEMRKAVNPPKQYTVGIYTDLYNDLNVSCGGRYTLTQ